MGEWENVHGKIVVLSKAGVDSVQIRYHMPRSHLTTGSLKVCSTKRVFKTGDALSWYIFRESFLEKFEDKSIQQYVDITSIVFRGHYQS